jgi:hypothetical protein
MLSACFSEPDGGAGLIPGGHAEADNRVQSLPFGMPDPQDEIRCKFDASNNRYLLKDFWIGTS